jgi:hypothetical protein
MKSGNVFVSLVEFLPDDNLKPGVGLYAQRGFPRNITLGDFNPSVLQVMRPGQAGLQRFFSVGNRPFSLYVVLGDMRGPAAVLSQAGAVLQAIDVRPVLRSTSAALAALGRRARSGWRPAAPP